MRHAERAAELGRLVEGATVLLEPEAKQLLSHYGLDSGEDRVCQTETQVVRAAETLGYPVVLKVVAPDIPHRLAEGLVVLDRRNKGEVRAGFRELSGRLARRPASSDSSTRRDALPREPSGALAFELALGVTRDQEFGSVVMLALGGARIELEPHRVFRSHR